MKLRILIRNSLRAFIGIIFFLSLSLFGGQPTNVRTFDEEEMKAYAEQQDFSYMNYTVRPPSIWERVGWWFQEFIQKFFLNPNMPWLMRIVYYLILVIIVGAAIFYIVRLRYGSALMSDYRKYQSGTSAIEQSTVEDFDGLLQDALSKENYKLAIRYLYLRSLKGLAKQGLLSLKDWKSPFDYQRELSGDQANTYREFAVLFEYVWYGDFEATRSDYDLGSDLSNKLEGTK